MDRNEDTRFGSSFRVGSSPLRNSRSGSTASDMLENRIGPDANIPLSLSLPLHKRSSGNDDDHSTRPGLPR
jgi:hypothetical protein